MKLRIRGKILLGFAVLLLVLFPVQFFAYLTSDNYVKREVDKDLDERANNALFLIENFISRTEIDYLGVAQAFREDKTPDYSDTIKLTDHTIKQNSFINKITVLSLSGRELIKIDRFAAATADELSFEIPTASFDAAVKGQTGISKVYYAEKNSAPQIDIFGPVISDKGTVVAVVKEQLKMGGLWDTLATVKLGKSGFAYVVDDEGRLIAHPDADLVLQGANFSQRSVVKDLLADKEDAKSYKYTNENNVDVISSGIKIPQLGWIAVVEEPYSEAFSQAILLKNLFIVTIIISTLLFAAISVFLSKQFTLPISKLMNFTESVREGELNSRVDIKSGDEIEELADSFNMMGNKLKIAFAEREDTISKLQSQKLRLDQSAKLLLRRDLNLRRAMDELDLEKELVEGERNKLQIIITGIKDGVIAVDLERNIILFNSAAELITGIESKDAIGKNIGSIFKIYDEDSREVPLAGYCPAIRGNYEGVVYSKNNVTLETYKKKTLVNLLVGQIKEGSRINLSNIITFHDITEWKELEKMKIDFVSMAAHELRTPLTAVQGYLSFLDDPRTYEKLSSEEKEYINRATLSAVKLNQLIENLLVVAKIEKGTMAVRPAPLQMEQIISKVLEDFSNFANIKGLELSFEKPDKPLPKVMADPLRIEEVIDNLIDNAINYTVKGSVKVGIKVKDKFMIIYVKDTGQGIPEYALPHLFTKFFRIQGELQSGSKGTGLGLYISKNIVQAHKGEIWVESKLNEGSVFYLSLPIAEDLHSVKSVAGNETYMGGVKA